MIASLLLREILFAATWPAYTTTAPDVPNHIYFDDSMAYKGSTFSKTAKNTIECRPTNRNEAQVR
jgi:hypothetical protein